MKKTLLVERRLSVSLNTSGIENKAEIVAQILTPVRSDVGWSCAYSVFIPSSQSPEFSDAYGEDGLQALLNAVEAMRQLIVHRYPEARWLSDTEGDIGFPIIITPYNPMAQSEFKLLQDGLWEHTVLRLGAREGSK